MRFECPYCGSTDARSRNGADVQCARGKCGQWSHFPGVLNNRSDDERELAERKWNAPTKPKAEQKPCDVGLFGDGHKQGDLF